MGNCLYAHAVRLASIDVGTNTALLCVADVTADGFTVVAEQEVFVRLGEGLETTGEISSAAAGRLLETMRDFRCEAESLGASKVIGVATSASRDARNAPQVLAAVEDATEIRLRVISGEEEARLTFLGGVSELVEDVGDVCSLDIGGGSSEITVGRWTGNGWVINQRTSTPAGAIRLRDRFFQSMPPTTEQVAAASAAVDGWLQAADPPEGALWLGTSGTTVALSHLLRRHDASAIVRRASGLYAVSRSAIERWTDQLLKMRAEDVLRLDPTVMTGRADVFPAGILVLAVAMRKYGISQFVVGSRGLRHGVLLSSAERD